MTHPRHGVTHVLGYRNTVENRSDGPNAMLLHLPAHRMTRAGFLFTAHHPELMDVLVDAVRPKDLALMGGIDWMGGDETRTAPAEVFDHDIYTVVLAADARAIPAALAEVPRHKRPRIDPDLIDFYATRYPDHVLALCCFDNAEAARAAPLFLRYRPHDPDLLTAAALDCHTGGPPTPGEPVVTDHLLVFGTDEAGPGWGEEVGYPGGTHGGGPRRSLRAFLPDRVMGAHFPHQPLPNGDFALAHTDLLAGRLDRIVRVPPTSWGPPVPAAPHWRTP
ncbi:MULTISPECIES: hypothetical protein [unclassified Streptomyces]|uniref:hypothetical protein n=1 Tax=unclassified Streptomyces TaxID=2593676 RepID=UPI001F22EA59|nr:hypothetical protein [Streptomyces sp. HmicA12]